MRKRSWAKGLIFGIILLVSGIMSIPSEVTIRTITATTAESVQLIINDDGSGDPTDRNVNVPAYSPDSGITPTLMINFTITGINSTQDTAFYGDNTWEDWRNITISGDILYPVDGTTLYHVGTKGDWNCCITPTKPYGVISLRIDWPGNDSANNSIQIVNGTFVTPHVDSFPSGKDYNLTVTVGDIDGLPVRNAEVYLIWEEDDTEFNHTTGNNKLGNGMNGMYIFWITKEDQGADAPKTITIAAQWYRAFWGYTKVLMKKPTPLPELEIGTITGGFGTKVQIKNIGTAQATNVSVTINFSGAWMILPLLEHYQTIFNLDAGLSENVSLIVFGLGKTTIDVEAICAEGSSARKTVTGTVFLFFMFGIQ